MFSGIIKNTAKLKKIINKGKSCTIVVKSNLKFTKKEIGSSIACSGTCLTLTKYRSSLLYFYLSKETLYRSNFKYKKINDIINLEKSLKHGDRISGHFVQGHVDTTCVVNSIRKIDKSWFIKFKIHRKYKKYIVNKGSIAINGISLTISKILKNEFQVVVIPQTLKSTDLAFLKKNDVVNIEFDVLGKYIKNFLN